MPVEPINDDHDNKYSLGLFSLWFFYAPIDPVPFRTDICCMRADKNNT